MDENRLEGSARKAFRSIFRGFGDLIAGYRIGTGLLLPAASSIAAITKSVAV
jgi:hypothetical protein